jgi:hypothetical protein
MKTDTQKKSGRPKSADPKKQVYIYIEQSVIDFHGGMEELRKYLTDVCYANYSKVYHSKVIDLSEIKDLKITIKEG